MKTMRAIACLACLAFSATAQAGLRDIRASNNQFMFQFTSINVDYAETGNGFGGFSGLLDTERGSVPGKALTVSGMTSANDIYFAFQISSYNGSTTYTGALQTGGAYGSVVASSSATIIDYTARLGKGFGLGEMFMLTPYGELGMHEWDRGVNYGEVYTHYYYGVGLLGQLSPAERVVLSLNALAGKNNSSYITVNSGPGLNGFSGSLGDSSLTRIGIAADYAFTPMLHGNIGVDVTRFKYGMSALYPVGGGFVAWEPDSTTKYRTLRFGLGLAF